MNTHMRARTGEGYSPRGHEVTVASFGSYREAEAAVDKLADRHFAVEHLAIVGHGLIVEEDVTGRRGFARAAAETAGTGAFTGAFIGFILGIFTVVEPLVSGLVLLLLGAAVGAVLGAILGLLSHAARGGRRDFSSVSTMSAQSYDIVADLEVANHARRILEGS